VRDTLDKIDPKLVFLATCFLLGLASEVGFRLARDGNEARKSQVGALLASMLGLLALLLAFTLTIVEDRFVDRSSLVVEEANSIDQAHLRAQLLPQPRADKVQELLREYVDVRLSVKKPADFAPALRKSDEIQHALWAEAAASAAEYPQSLPVSLFVSSINHLIDIGQQRVAETAYRRLPPKLLGTLFIVALLAFFVQGHNGGLSSVRVPIAALVVGVSVAVVLTMIVDIDRPWQGGVRVNQQPLQNVRQTLVARR
jgi:hypothetical protein